MILSWLDLGCDDQKEIIDSISNIGKGAVDNLGFGIVRNHFQDKFFPGITTIQTRAKYFLICPYIILDMRNEKALTEAAYKTKIKKKERACCDRLKIAVGENNNKNENTSAYDDTEVESTDEAEGVDKNGIIGSTVTEDKWIKRTPMDIYWSGLKSFNILDSSYKNVSYSAFCREIRKYDSDREIWNIETYEDNWEEKLDIHLNYNEAVFLRNQIINSQKDSILAWLLKNDINLEIIKGSNEVCTLFDSIDLVLKKIPEEKRPMWTGQYHIAKDLSDFLFCIQVRYNVIAGYTEASTLWETYRDKLINYCSKNGEENYKVERLLKYVKEINDRNKLHVFISEVVDCVRNDRNFEERLDEIIRNRERSMKQERAILGKVNDGKWKGLWKLGYRCNNAVRIIKDIKEGIKKENA